jgi:hypothetical protein
VEAIGIAIWELDFVYLDMTLYFLSIVRAWALKKKSDVL